MGALLDVSGMVIYWPCDSRDNAQLHNCGHGNRSHMMTRIHIRFFCFLWFGQLCVTRPEYNMRKSSTDVVVDHETSYIVGLPYSRAEISFLVLPCPSSPL